MNGNARSTALRRVQIARFAALHKSTSSRSTSSAAPRVA